MNKKSICMILSLLLVLGLCACSEQEPPEHTSGPGRMVRRIEIASHPEDPNFVRTYTTQENMNALLGILRTISTDQEPEQAPDLEGGQNYYTATVTFANGERSIYYLLGHTYMRQGDEPWYLIDPERSEEFVHFLRDHPSDDSSAPEA